LQKKPQTATKKVPMSCKRFTLAERGKLEFMLDKEKIALDHWTPQLVAGRLALEYPDTPKMWVSHETIYRKIYTTGHYLDLLRKELPQAREKRRKRGQGKHRREPHSISQVYQD